MEEAYKTVGKKCIFFVLKHLFFFSSPCVGTTTHFITSKGEKER